MASRVIVDDVLPLPSGPGLLLRRVENGITKWDLVALRYDGGKPSRTPLPVTMPSPRSHARGDVRGDRILLLMFDDALPQQKAAQPPQLVVFSFN